MPIAQTLDRIGKRSSRSSASRYPVRRTLALLLPVLLAGPLSGPAAAQASAGREVTIVGEQSKQQFAAGGSVRIRANVADDVFAAGREIGVEGARAHTMFLAGGTIAIRDSTVRDLFAAAHDVAILGTIEDDALIAVCPVCPWGSGRLLLGPQARIGDDARLVAGSVEIEGTVGGDLRATARRIVISGTVSGKADLTAKEIVIATGARLAGELVTRSPKPAEIAAGASVAGPVRAIETEVNIPDPRDLPRMLGWIAAAAAGILIVGALVLAALVQLAAPGILSQGAARMRAELWGCVGRGLAWALILPAIGLLLFVSLIGLPAAVLLMATLLLLWALAFVTSAYAIGLWVRNRRAAAAPEPRAGGRIGWTLLGIVVLLVAGAVPIVGWILAVLALLGGLGAVAGGLWRRVRHADAPAPSGSA